MHNKKVLCQRQQESEPNFHSDLWEVNNDDLYDLFCMMRLSTAPIFIVQWGPKTEKLGTKERK